MSKEKSKLEKVKGRLYDRIPFTLKQMNWIVYTLVFLLILTIILALIFR